MKEHQKFYLLRSPSLIGKDSCVWGEESDTDKFARARWGSSVTWESKPCPLFPEDHRWVGARTESLSVILESPHLGDFVWTWLGDCLLSARVAAAFRDASLTGYILKPVNVEKILGIRKKRKDLSAELWELVVVGRGGDPSPRSKIKVLFECAGCGMKVYSSGAGYWVNRRNWDGSDFFKITPRPNAILVTNKVREVITRERFSNCALIEATSVSWPEGIPKPEDDVYPEFSKNSKGPGSD